MGSGSIGDDVIKSLTGRAKVDGPVCSRINAAQVNTTLPENYIDKLFIQDDDSYSMSSFAPSTAPTELDNVSYRSVPQRAPSPQVANNKNTADSQSVQSSSSSVETQSLMSSDSVEKCSQVATAATSDSGTTDNGQNSQQSIRRKPNVKKSHRRPSTAPTSFKRSLSPQDVIKEGEVLNISSTTEAPSPLVSGPLVMYYS